MNHTLRIFLLAVITSVFVAVLPNIGKDTPISSSSLDKTLAPFYKTGLIRHRFQNECEPFPCKQDDGTITMLLPKPCYLAMNCIVKDRGAFYAIVDSKLITVRFRPRKCTGKSPEEIRSEEVDLQYLLDNYEVTVGFDDCERNLHGEYNCDVGIRKIGWECGLVIECALEDMQNNN